MSTPFEVVGQDKMGITIMIIGMALGLFARISQNKGWISYRSIWQQKKILSDEEMDFYHAFFKVPNIKCCSSIFSNKENTVAFNFETWGSPESLKPI
ncbi:MAG: hypothetical protein KAJ23_07150 [Maribacter sp.]|nr:hypothetical protein [Maribacter sp.]